MTRSTESAPSESATTSAASADGSADPGISATTADTADAATDAAGAAGDVPEPKVAFGGLTPSEAARRRWDRKRAQDEDADQSRAAGARADVALVRVTVETGAVIDRLAKDAKAGNTQAARELREWLARVEVETDLSISALDRVTRQRMKARLLAELQEGDAQEGIAPAAPSPPSADAHVDSGTSGQAEPA